MRWSGENMPGENICGDAAAGEGEGEGEDEDEDEDEAARSMPPPEKEEPATAGPGASHANGRSAKLGNNTSRRYVPVNILPVESLSCSSGSSLRLY